MIKRKWLFVGLLSIVLVFSLVFVACDSGGGETTKEELPPPPAVEKPIIKEQSGTKRYITGTPVKELSVTIDELKVIEGVTLTYQWFTAGNTFTNETGTPIEGKSGTIAAAKDGSDWKTALTTTTYQPTADAEGTNYYYVTITNPARPDEEDPLEEAVTASAPMGVIVLDSLPTTDATVTVTDTQNQYVRAFGGMSNAFGIGAPARYMQMADIETMFGPGGLGLKVLRIMIWPQGLDAVISGQVEPQMGNAATYINAVKKVNEYGGYVLASPWTAPAYMKTNESLAAGGSLKESAYSDYAEYLRGFAFEMGQKGAPIYAISLQNEPSLKVSYDGMEWTPAEHRNFLRDHGNFTRRTPAIKGSGVAWDPIKGGYVAKQTDFVKVVSGEPHQQGTWYNQAMDAVLANPTALANMDIVAYHI